MDRKALPATQASFVSPGGFVAFEHLLAVTPAVGLHKDIGRDHIAARIHELNTAFREGARSIKGLTLHTPIDRDVSAGLSCFDIAGLKATRCHARLRRKIRTSGFALQGFRTRIGRHHERTCGHRHRAARTAHHQTYERA
jgi:selenocysteine lyase/cysteine desulfurase